MSPVPMPPLAAVRVFEAAARHQSFTRAAGELGMTQAAVSYQIKLLEERVGTPLFRREARGVALTEAGQRLAPAVAEAFSRLSEAFSELDDRAKGVLAVSSVQTFASNWLVPRIGAFQIGHPDIAVRLDVSGHMVDFAREEVDVGIRSGRGQWPGLTAHHLMTAEFTPLLSPRLLERFGPLKEPADLLALPLIETWDQWWIDWFEAVGVSAPDLDRRAYIRLGTQQLIGSVAVAGHGAAILTPAFFADDIAAGRLVQPFGHVHNDGSSYWLVYPEGRRRSPKIRAFRDWLLGQIDGPIPARQAQGAGP